MLIATYVTIKVSG